MGQQAEMKHLATGNLIGDAVVNAYYSKGLRDGIHVELVGHRALRDLYECDRQCLRSSVKM